MTPIVPNKFSNFNLMSYPAQWNREEYNNQVLSCPINGRDVGFCQLIRYGDPVSFSFKAAYGDDLYNAILASGLTTSVNPNQLIDSGASFNTINPAYFDTSRGALVYNGLTDTTTMGINPVTAPTIDLVDDIFTAIGESYAIIQFYSQSGNWFMKPNLILTRTSDTSTAAVGKIIGLMQVGLYYRLKLSVQNWQRGSFLVSFGAGGTEVLIEGNGTFEVYGQCSPINNDLFIASSTDQDWVGEILLDTIELNEIVTDYTIGFWTDPEQPPIITTNATLSYCNNGVMQFVSENRFTEDIYSIDDQDKCGYFGIVSGQCAGIKLLCGEYQITPSDPTYVIVDPDTCAVEFKDAPAAQYVEVCSDCIIAGHVYRVQFAVGGYVEGRVGLFYNNQLVGNSISQDGEYAFEFTAVNGVNCFRFIVSTEVTNLQLTDVVIDYIITEADFLSECFYVYNAFTTDCSIPIQFNTGGNYGRCNAQDIEFIRVCARTRNSALKDITYSYLKNTTGAAAMMSANLLDQRELVVSPVPPYLIRALQIALRSPYLIIDSVQYVSVGEITPDYNDNTELGRIIAAIAPVNQSDTYGII